MIAQIVVFSRKTDAQRKKNFAFFPQKLRKSFANGNPRKKVILIYNYFTGNLREFWYHSYVKFLISRKVVDTILSSFEMKTRDFFMKTLQLGRLYYLIFLWDHKVLYFPLLRISQVGNVGQKVVSMIIK